MPTSRRELLLAAAAAAATPAFAGPGASAGFVTDAGGRRFAPAAALAWRAASAGPAPARVTVDLRDLRQELLGFGSAFTEAACVTLARLDPAARAALIRELYGPESSGGLGLSVVRTCIGSSDYATEVFSYDEGAPDPALSRFGLDHDRAAVLPVLKALRAARPDLFHFASPWSPPGWMKYGGSMLGGSIKPDNLAVYARYIGRYLDAYAAEGLPVSAVTVQNEIDADQGGRMPACAWPQETDRDYMVKFLGPELARRGGRTKLWMLDHNYDLSGRVLADLQHREVREVVDAVAWHGYVGDPREMSRVHDAHPSVGAHWTEGGQMYDDADFMTGWSRWAATIAGVLNNRAESFTVWNAALDERGRPNIGPFTCGGLVTVRSDTGAVERPALYYALGHYGRAFRRGDRVVGSRTPAGSGLSATAARGTDGRVALVLVNPGPARAVELAAGGRVAHYAAPADSVSTLRWTA